MKDLSAKVGPHASLCERGERSHGGARRIEGDRGTPIPFTFDGQLIDAFAGATVAADGFSLIVEESRARGRKSFSVRGGQVKMESEGPAPPALPTPVKIIGGQGEVGGTSNWFDRLFGRWRAPT